MDDVEIQTERLCLRQLRASDADRLVAVTNNLEISRHLLKTPHPYQLEDARALIARGMEPQSRIWGIDDSHLVGIIGLRGEFGFWLAPKVWGRGYASEAGAAVIDHAFQSLRFDEIRASPMRENMRSRNVLRKLMFEEIGDGSAFSIGQAKAVSIVNFQLRKTRWETSITDG